MKINCSMLCRGTILAVSSAALLLAAASAQIARAQNSTEAQSAAQVLTGAEGFVHRALERRGVSHAEGKERNRIFSPRIKLGQLIVRFVLYVERET